MLSIVLLVFVARTFYALAEKYGKSDWGFAALSVASYLGGIFIGGAIIGVVMEMVSPAILTTTVIHYSSD